MKIPADAGSTEFLNVVILPPNLKIENGRQA
jgi:hypothetical protein